MHAGLAPNHLFRTSTKDRRTKLTRGAKPRGIRSRRSGPGRAAARPGPAQIIADMHQNQNARGKLLKQLRKISSPLTGGGLPARSRSGFASAKAGWEGGELHTRWQPVFHDADLKPDSSGSSPAMTVGEGGRRQPFDGQSILAGWALSSSSLDLDAELTSLHPIPAFAFGASFSEVLPRDTAVDKGRGTLFASDK